MKSYLITDPKYYTNNPDRFKNILNEVLNTHTIDMICFRDKISANTTQLAEVFAKVVKQYNIKSFINGDIELGSQLNLYGVHLRSDQFDQIKKAKKLNLHTIISCHDQSQIEQAIKQGANMITYSPIFTTPNKGEPKGIQQLQTVVDKYNIPIIALGGIVTKDHIEQISKTNPYGFASIRYFVNI